ncbi:MAG: RadC family protein [Oscillospiraceae bacterium]|nr:RadC family protein [Oscillospiraceae bacterium]
MDDARFKEKNLHEGHRSRMLETFSTTGLDAFSDVEVLEFLLFYSISRRDVNPLAHLLLEEFGSLHRVLEATPAQLMRVPGIGPRSAALIHLVSALRTRTEQSRYSGEVFLRTTSEIGAFLSSRTEGLREERAWLLSMDAKCKLIECRELCRGAVNSVNLPFRKLVEAALLANASVVILAHNHTSGTLLPSPEDLEYTRNAVHALQMVDIVLTDHFILNGRAYLSLQASGML